MPPEKNNNSPFLTRSMLSFGEGASFKLRIRSQAKDALPIAIRGVTKDGPFSNIHIPSGSFNATTQDFNLTDIPMFLSVTDSNSSFLRGQCHITLQLLVNGEIVQDLCAGYVSVLGGISWPQTNIQSSIPGRGQFVTIAGADPAIDAEIVDEVPQETTWRLLGMRFAFVTDAAVANRIVHVVLKNGSTVIADIVSGTAQTGGTTKNYSVVFGLGAGTFADDNDIIIPAPSDFWLPSGFDIATTITNRQPDDDLGAATYYVERFIETV